MDLEVSLCQDASGRIAGSRLDLERVGTPARLGEVIDIDPVVVATPLTVALPKNVACVGDTTRELTLVHLIATCSRASAIAATMSPV